MRAIWSYFFNTVKPHLEYRVKNVLPVRKYSSSTAISKFCTSSQDDSTKKQKSFRHNYHEEVESAVNQQILIELNASMAYLSMLCYYGRTDIAMPGCHSFFKKMYAEEQEHAMEFINYQLLRGGQVKLFPITVPETNDWTDITIALGVAIELEKMVKEKLECLHEVAETHKDMHLMDLVNAKFIREQNESIWEIGRLLTIAKRVVDTGGVGRYLFDREVFNYVSGKHPGVASSQYI